MHNVLIAVAAAYATEMGDHPNSHEWVKVNAIDGLIYDVELAHGAALYQDKSKEFDIYKEKAMELYAHDRACMRKAMNKFGDAAGMRTGSETKKITGLKSNLILVIAIAFLVLFTTFFM